MAKVSVELHEKALKAMNERILKGENVDVQEEITHLLKEDSWLFELRELLTRAVNSQISYKMKDRYNTERTYFELRNKIEDGVIATTNWFSYFESEVTLEELSKPIKNFPLKTLMLIIIEALKQYVDNGEEENPKCLLLKNIYLNLQSSLLSQIPDYPQEDGSIEYLKTKQHRIDLEDCRITGSICHFCNSTDVKSFGANWKCRTCGREFRKHRKKEEDS